MWWLCDHNVTMGVFSQHCRETRMKICFSLFNILVLRTKSMIVHKNTVHLWWYLICNGEKERTKKVKDWQTHSIDSGNWIHYGSTKWATICKFNEIAQLVEFFLQVVTKQICLESTLNALLVYCRLLHPRAFPTPLWPLVHHMKIKAPEIERKPGKQARCRWTPNSKWLVPEMVWSKNKSSFPGKLTLN